MSANASPDTIRRPPIVESPVSDRDALWYDVETEPAPERPPGPGGAAYLGAALTIVAVGFIAWYWS